MDTVLMNSRSFNINKLFVPYGRGGNQNSLNLRSPYKETKVKAELYSFKLELLFQEQSKNSCVLDRLSLQRLFGITEESQAGRKAQRKVLRRIYNELMGIKELFPREDENWEPKNFMVRQLFPRNGGNWESNFQSSINVRELFPRYFDNDSEHEFKDFALKRLYQPNLNRCDEHSLKSIRTLFKANNPPDCLALESFNLNNLFREETIEIVMSEDGKTEIRMTPSMLSCIEFLWPAATTVWEEMTPQSSYASLDNNSISKLSLDDIENNLGETTNIYSDNKANNQNLLITKSSTSLSQKPRKPRLRRILSWIGKRFSG